MLSSSSVRQQLSLFKPAPHPVSPSIGMKIELLKQLNEQLQKREEHIQRYTTYFTRHPDALSDYIIATDAGLKAQSDACNSICLEDSREGVEAELTELAHEESLLKKFTDRAKVMAQSTIPVHASTEFMWPLRSRGPAKLTTALESSPEEDALRAGAGL